MEDVDFSDAFCRFIQTCVPTVEIAEALIAGNLDALRSSGLAEDEIARDLATLKRAYDERPVTLVRVIYALRVIGFVVIIAAIVDKNRPRRAAGASRGSAARGK